MQKVTSLSSKRQYQLVKDYSLIRVTGPDSEKFLQGQLTCDLSKAASDKALLGGYCNVKGRLHASFYLLKQEQDFLLVLPTSTAENLVATLSKYAVFFQTKMQIEQGTTFYCLTHSQITVKQDNNFSVTELDNGLSIQLSDPAKSSLNILFADSLFPQSQPQDLWPDAQSSQQSLWQYAQLNCKIPMIFAETVEQLLPHYVGLDTVGGISFDKGCYTGQEVVARMHYRGSLKTHPQLARINTLELFVPGTEIINEAGKKVGQLIYCAINDDNNLALISLADKALEQSIFIQQAPITLIETAS